ncbi:CoA-binding protein [Legionella beliardensis]|uniref:CoA-binding protein n=1 Tax=Legionella beliardensis TaxID=91822 RepID=A0A378I1M2_9GAMM|nr:CoA-binding protein [Legionella beliardensis]STX28585.1 CoA-binding protein [Legionella beliardensis]
MDNNIDRFFKSQAYGVVGASSNRYKYGNKVLRCYMQHQMKVYPVNLYEETIENLSAVQSVEELPSDVESISIITPPSATEKVVEQAIQKGIKNIWMQPGAESDQAILRCKEAGINIIAGGPCILVILGFTDN